MMIWCTAWTRTGNALLLDVIGARGIVLTGGACTDAQRTSVNACQLGFQNATRSVY